MIEGKEAGFARKRKARDKANLRLIKNRHLIVPGFAAALMLGMLLGGSVGFSVSVDAIGPGAIAGSWVGVLLFGHLVLRDVMR